MEAMVATFLRDQLMERRQKLEAAIPIVSESEPLLHLLHEVDTALNRMNEGTYGLCEVCHESVEKERLIVDPLTKRCLDHLSPQEQADLAQDLDMAWRIQSELLPKRKLQFGSWDISYHYEAVGPVSGDYCDVLTTEDDELIFLIGDVSGKGVAASMLMAHLHAMFRSLISVGLPFNQLMERANRVFCNSTMPTFFATLICGKAGKSGNIELFNAGHCPPLWIGDRGVETIEATGMPLGLFCNSPYQLRRITMDPLDCLLLYTDGLTEARNSRDEEYGTGRLVRIASENRLLSPEALVSSCLADLASFQSGVPKADDLAAMVIRRSAS